MELEGLKYGQRRSKWNSMWKKKKNIYLSGGNLIQNSNFCRDSETWKAITLQKGSWTVVERKIGTNSQCSVTAVRFSATLGRICRSVTSQTKKDNNPSVCSAGTASFQILRTTCYWWPITGSLEKESRKCCGHIKSSANAR